MDGSGEFLGVIRGTTQGVERQAQAGGGSNAYIC